MKQIFQEASGQFSTMRVMSFVALVIAGLYTFADGSDINILIVWVVGAFAPKAIQKFAEKK